MIKQLKKSVVWLTKAEIAYATDAGILRNIENRKAGKISDVIGSSLKSDIQGARAEYAASQYFRLPWTGRFMSND